MFNEKTVGQELIDCSQKNTWAFAMEQTKKEERRLMADLITTKLDRLSAHIRSQQLAPVEAAELLQSEIQRIEAELFS